MSNADSQSSAIDSLEDKLARLARKFRGSPDEQHAIAEEYAEVMRLLLQFSQWDGAPDAESQLPSEFMPDVYRQYWDKRIGSVLSVVQEEIAGCQGIHLRRGKEAFQAELATIIQRANLEFGLPSAEESDRIPTACKQLGLLAIFLNAEVDGKESSDLAWRICRRVLLMTNVQLSDSGKNEFSEKLNLKHVSDFDIILTLTRHCTLLADGGTADKDNPRLGMIE